VDPDKLSAAERALWQAFPRGELVSLTKARGVRARTVRAEVITALLLGAAPPEPGRIAAVRLDGARIAGTLGLGHAVITGPVRMRHCDDLLAFHAVVNGQLRLAAARIGGMVGLDGATLRHEGHRVLHGSKLSVGAGLLARFGFSAAGEVSLADANVGELDLRGATLSNPGGNALLATGLRAGADIRLSGGFSAHGVIRLSRAWAGAEIHMAGVRVANPGGNAIRCRYAQASAFVLDSSPSVDGTVDLCYSQFTVIRDDPSCWPRELRVSGLIKQVAPSVKVVMLTIRDQEEDRFEAIRAGASGYLLKDIPLDKVAEAVRALIT
jgi:hypothetical protein